jgi:hypothetical protein
MEVSPVTYDLSSFWLAASDLVQQILCRQRSRLYAWLSGTAVQAKMVVDTRYSVAG